MAERTLRSFSATLAALAGLALTAGCGGAAGPAPARPAEGDRASGRAAFARGEAEILAELAAIDQRLAARLRIRASEEALRRLALAAVLHEDSNLAVAFGAVDPFSFEARARGLESARQKLALLPKDGQTPSERVLVERLIAAEIGRVEEERSLPRSASGLVRAIVETWTLPTNERETEEADRWLARRLGTVREALRSPADPSSDLDVVRARELDDTLDALERLTQGPGFARTTQELVRLRDALEAKASRPAAKAQSDWSAVTRRITTHLGAPVDSNRGAIFGELLRELRPRAEQAITAAAIERDALGTALESAMFPPEPCADRIESSPVRSIAAAPERQPGCQLRHRVAAATSDRERALALAALHDHVVVGLWALEVARGSATIAEAEGKRHLLAPISPTARARYERMALARPVAAIGAAETAVLLMERARGEPDPFTRARAWSAIGDAPLDVVAEVLGR